jgi:hypothetical protein
MHLVGDCAIGFTALVPMNALAGGGFYDRADTGETAPRGTVTQPATSEGEASGR